MSRLHVAAAPDSTLFCLRVLLPAPGRGIPGATPMRTPIRDQLGLNDPTAAGGGYTAEEIVSLRAQKLAQAEMRAQLRAGLSTLPAPENEYSVALPEQLPEDEEGEGLIMEEDAADIKARKAREAEAARLAAEKEKSQVGFGRVILDGLPQFLMACQADEVCLSCKRCQSCWEVC